MFQDCIKYLLHFPPPKFIGEEVSIYDVNLPFKTTVLPFKFLLAEGKVCLAES